MKDTAFIKNIDMLGRVAIPLEIRQELDLDMGSALEVFVDGDEIILIETEY